MKQEEASMVKKTGTKGPGGCKGKQECENFCNKEENQETCFNFAVSKNLISPEELQNMKEGSNKFMTGLNSLPTGAKTLVEQCIKNKIGEDKYNKMISGESIMDKNIGPAIKDCFESSMKDFSQNMIQQGMPTTQQNIQSGEKPIGEMPPAMPQTPQGAQDGMGMGMGMGMPLNTVQGELPLNMPKDLNGILPPGMPSAQDIQNMQQEAMKSIPQGMTIPQNITVPSIPQVGAPQN
jgi:hypothetical protein